MGIYIHNRKKYRVTPGCGGIANPHTMIELIGEDNPDRGERALRIMECLEKRGQTKTKRYRLAQEIAYFECLCIPREIIREKQAKEELSS